MENSKLLINEHPLQVLPSLAIRLGLEAAIVLQQIHYWLRIHASAKSDRHFKDGRYWVYNTCGEWQKQFAWWSVPTIKRILLELEQINVVKSERFEEKDRNQRKWYSIDYAVLNRIADLPDDLWNHRRDERIKLIQSELERSKRSIASDQIDPLEEINLIHSNGSKRSDDLIDPEITPKTTPEITYIDIERESEKKEIESEAIKESAGVTTDESVPHDSPTSLQEIPQISRQPEDLSLGNGSAAAASMITKESRTPTTWIGRSGAQKTEDRFNNVVPKWRNSDKTNDFKSSFVDYLIRLYLPDQDPYRTNGKKPTKGNANNWINSREFQGRDAEIESIYEDALLSMPTPNSVGDAALQSLPQTWGEWAREAEKRRLMEFSQSAGSDILVHLKGGTSRLWSELRSLSWDALADLTN